MPLADLYRLIEEQLSARTRSLRTLVSHRSSIGWVNEQTFGGLLRTYLPQRCALGSGFVLAADGKKSKQGDVLIYNAQDHPVLFREGDLVVLPPEALLGVIEVKTRESEAFLKDALANIASYKELCPHVFSAIMFLEPPANWATAKSHLDAARDWDERPPDDRLPDHLTYLGSWTAHWATAQWTVQESGAHSLLLLLIALHLGAIGSSTLQAYTVDIESPLVETLDWSATP